MASEKILADIRNIEGARQYRDLSEGEIDALTELYGDLDAARWVEDDDDCENE